MEEMYEVLDCECGERIVTIGYENFKDARCPNLNTDDPLWWLKKTDRSHMSNTVVERAFTSYPLDFPQQVAYRKAILQEALRRSGLKEELESLLRP